MSDCPDTKKRIYSVIFTHAIGHPYFDDIITESLPPEKNIAPTFCDRAKKYLIRFIFFVQSDSSVKFLLSLLTLNCIYERITNAKFNQGIPS